MAGIIKSNVQLGDSATATQNFTLTAAAADGTMKLARGNAGATTQDILSIDASSNLSTGQSFSSSTLIASTNITTPSINNGQLSGFRNKIINGNMVVSQVNGGTAVTPTATATYPLDQWWVANTQASKLTFQQVADAPPGFKYSTKITVASQFSPGAADYFAFSQPIEGQNIVDFQLGTAGAVTIATSNYIKGSVPGTYAVSLRNGAYNRGYIGTINVTTSWTRVVITLGGDVSGTWATDNTIGLVWSLDLGSGSNFNTTAGAWQAGNYLRTAGCVTFVNQTAGSTLNITGVQIEQVSPGATAGTAFEHVPYATQLAWCQRYLPCFNGNAGSTSIPASGSFTSTTNARLLFIFPVPTRIAPTGVSSPNAAYISVQGNSGTNYAVSAINFISVSHTNCAWLDCTVTGAIADKPVLGWLNNAAAQIYFTGAQL